MTPKLYKAADVCESVGVQPYVLRSWEKEFPGIGVQKSEESPRLYRQSDVEHVLRIKQLVFGEGLTLAGARRRLEETMPQTAGAREAEAAEMAEVLSTLGADARARITLVRSGLRSILDVLSKRPGSIELAELRRAVPSGDRSAAAPADRRGRTTGRPEQAKSSANGGGRSAASGSSKARPKARHLAARGKSSPSKRAVTVKRTVAVKRGGKRSAKRF